MVHNGIIENYASLKEYLKGKGYTFRSCTDTEVLVQLVQFMQDEYGKDLEGAVVMALRRVIGAYAIAVIDKAYPDKIVVAKKSSPLTIGVGEGNKEFFIASDALPIVPYTNQMVYLNDNEVALLKVGQKMEIRNLDNKEISHDIKEVDINLESLEKGGFEHFMLKEIFDQPRCMADCMRGRLLLGEKRIVLSTLNLHRDELVKGARRGGVRLGVPLPQPRNPAWRRCNSHIAERRDGRHAGSVPAGKREQRPMLRHRQRRRLEHCEGI